MDHYHPDRNIVGGVPLYSGNEGTFGDSTIPQWRRVCHHRNLILEWTVSADVWHLLGSALGIEEVCIDPRVTVVL